MDEQRSEGDKESLRLWRVLKCAREMCKDRGYEILDEEVDITWAQFKTQYTEADGRPDRKKMSFSLRPTDEMLVKYHNPHRKLTNPDGTPARPEIGTVWVEFNGDSNVGIKQLRNFAHHLSDHNYATGIFVSAVPITNSALKIVPVQNSIIETFQEQDLMVNITKHELVPKHELLSLEDKKALLQRYRLKESQLPRIQTGDPVARYLGLRRGQVVKIIRQSETAGRYASYRWCI